MTQQAVEVPRSPFNLTLRKCGDLVRGEKGLQAIPLLRALTSSAEFVSTVVSQPSLLAGTTLLLLATTCQLKGASKTQLRDLISILEEVSVFLSEENGLNVLADRMTIVASDLMDLTLLREY